MILLEIKDKETNKRSLAVIETIGQYVRDMKMRFTEGQFEIMMDDIEVQIKGVWNEHTGELQVESKIKPVTIKEILFMNRVKEEGEREVD